MKRIYELVFWLVMLLGLFHACRSYRDYGRTWRYDAYWLPESIVGPTAPFDTLNAVGRGMEKPLWALFYVAMPVMLGVFLWSCHSLAKAQNRLARLEHGRRGRERGAPAGQAVPVAKVLPPGEEGEEIILLD